MHTFDPWQKRTDRFSILLGFFFLLLLVLFIYLMKIDKDIKYYDTYHHTLEEIRIYDYQMNSFFLRPFRYMDYDETTKLERDFEKKLLFLQKNGIRDAFGEEVYGQVNEIVEAYTKKKRYFEDFKTLNARVTNSIHVLFDLRKTLENELIDKPEKKALIDVVFFSISQILMGVPYDEKMIKQKLKVLSTMTEEYQNVAYFIRHSKHFLLNVKQINQIRQQAESIPLLAMINRLTNDLENTYQQNMLQQKLIALYLFLFALIILSLLIFTYRRIRKYTKELQAFKYAIEKSDNAIMITNLEREIEYVNEAFERISGYRKYEVMGKNPNILKSGEMPSKIYKQMNETLERGKIWQGELINRRKNGEIYYEKTSIVPVIMDGELMQYLAIKLDVTEYKRQQQYLKLSGMVYDIIGDGIVVTDKEKRIISVNPAFTEMFGYSADELIGQEPMIIKTMQEDDYFYRQMWDQLISKDRWSGKLHNQAKDGTILPIWLSLAIVRNEKGEIENFIAIYTNLQEIIATQERAEYLAYHDSLTGLPNRAYFDLRIGDILELARMSHDRVALFFLDLDRFKVINDTLGHAVGDEMLIVLSKRIRNILNEHTLFARTGGDEFVIMSVIKQGREEASQLAEKVLSIVREPVKVHDYLLNTSASIGISVYPDDAKEKNELVKYADSAMYAAKDMGKDTYQFYTRKLSLDIQTRLNLEQELMYAIEREEFILYYQPQYYLAGGKVTGVEALLRWHSMTLGPISPDAFISIAEETGMIVKIGYFVFEEACKAFMRWKKKGIDIESIAVNVSAVQFRDERFIETLQDILHRTGMAPEALEIEITERFIMEYSTSNMTILDELRILGCVIAIDDFGTGYSSMSYMKQLPLDVIKIDRSFIMDIPESIHDMEVSKAIIALAHSLGYKVIAEGIETADQEAFLKENRCEMGQGYNFAKPMDEKALINFLIMKKTENNV